MTKNGQSNWRGFEEGTPEAVVGDGGRLQQILIHLMNKAVKFRIGRGFAAGTDDGHHHDRAEFRLAVRNTGIGIPSDRIGQLLDGGRGSHVASVRSE